MNMQTAIRFAPPASQAAFEKFHEENPHVYIELVKLTRALSLADASNTEWIHCSGFCASDIQCKRMIRYRLTS